VLASIRFSGGALLKVPGIRRNRLLIRWTALPLSRIVLIASRCARYAALYTLASRLFWNREESIRAAYRDSRYLSTSLLAFLDPTNLDATSDSSFIIVYPAFFSFN
jgi:hypothetical protein